MAHAPLFHWGQLVASWASGVLSGYWAQRWLSHRRLPTYYAVLARTPDYTPGVFLPCLTRTEAERFRSSLGQSPDTDVCVVPFRFHHTHLLPYFTRAKTSTNSPPREQ